MAGKTPAHDLVITMSIWLEIARLKFPQHVISGDGTLAVVQECSAKVVLCQTPMLAQGVAAEKCGNNCSHAIAPDGNWHRLVRLDAVPIEAPPRIVRQRAIWERGD